MRKTTLVLVLCFLITQLFVNAQEKEKEVEKRTYQTTFTEKPPDIDGLPDDECWNKVEWANNFTQRSPYENQPPTQQTSFKILYDNNNLYVLVRAHDNEAEKISRILSRRDHFDGDMVEINIDSDFDKQTAFSFTAMASGAKGDEMISLNGDNWDGSWNPVWFLETTIDDKGWYAEMRIPFTQLRFGKKEEHVWGIQVMRHIHREQERSHWQYIPKNAPGWVSFFGELHGIKNIQPKRQIEILPYVVAKTETFEKEEGNPFANGKRSNISAGIDGKIGITNNFTLDFSVNPDFGQVEADPSEVNLTAFESYFSERRPFFVEGKNIYEFRPSNTYVIGKYSSDNLFYSRRIGRYPHHYPDTEDDEYVNMPEATTIIAALKLSGKTKKGLSIGVMESVTANEKAEIDNNGERREESVEPLTNYFVGRVQKDFNKGQTILGGMVTAVNRDITNPDMNYLHREAYAGGIDFEHNWNDRTWYVASNSTFSNVLGNEEAILATQTSSARYYQRPDASHLSVDSSLTSLQGYGTTLRFGNRSKKRIQFQTSITLRSPGHEFNDMGYMRYSDNIHHGTWVGYYIRNPFSIFRNFYLNMNYWMYWDFSGELLSTYFNTNFNTQFKNKWRFNASLTQALENISTTMLRGGPSFKNPEMFELNYNISSDYSKKVSFYTGNYHGWGNNSSEKNHWYWFGIEIKPMNSLSLSIDPEFGSNYSQLQYIETADMNGENRYIFGSLDQKTFHFTFRINYTITPDLSIQYYGQPFISSGKYSDLKRITDPRAESFNNRYHIFSGNESIHDEVNEVYNIDENLDGTTDYTIDNPDFNFQQFRSNLVVRWEYSPGSTVYLVWSQGRTASGSNGRFNFDKDMDNLFGIQPHNVFLIKFNYWFSL